MKTWHELVQVEAQFYPAGRVDEAFNPVADTWWFANGKTDIVEATLWDTIAGRVYSLECAAIRFTITPIASTDYMPMDGYVSQLDFEVHENDGFEWAHFVNGFAGIVMGKRLTTPTQSHFQFITRWSLFEDVMRDQEGFKDSSLEYDIEGELNLNTLKVEYSAMHGLRVLNYMANTAAHHVNVSDIAKELHLSVVSNEVQHSLWWLTEKKLVAVERGVLLGNNTAYRLTERGRAYLRGEIQPE